MKANKYKIVSIFFAILLSWSCQEIVDLDLEQSEPRFVIEGDIVNTRSFKTIKISKSLNYYDTGRLAPVVDANIELLDNTNNVITEFIYNPQDSNYTTIDSLALEIGSEYKVQIMLKDELFEASGKILENATLDSIYYLSDQQIEDIGQQAFGEGYFMFVNGKLNNEGIEYFKLDVSVNDTLRNSRGDLSNSILTSEFFGKEFIALPVPGLFEAQDTVDLELYTLNEEVYQYYVEFINLLFNDGGVFSPPPVNPTTNIRNLSDPENKPLGFIQFSSYQKRRIIIDEPE